MKQIEFKTSNGEFVVFDMSDFDYDILGINGRKLEKIASITDITEEQAKEVVDDMSHMQYRNYKGLICFFSALGSLHYLLEANGVVFENTLCGNCQNGCPVCCGYGHMCDGWNKQQTYLFKKI